ncbi:MAG: glycosyltransferase family 4 protein [Thermoleophilia bacterium]|nr:glycosyltransferase family 4 protein [Thermoleophilia bacterium]
MKILQVNKFWRVQGGTERYVFELSRMLAGLGHEIVPFAMMDENNEPSPYSSLFVSPVELSDPYRVPFWKRAGIAGRIIYSREARSRISALADIVRPDVAHIHNIYHHMSPSILPPLRERGIGAVMTIHDYKLFCPALRHYNSNGVCDSCRPFHYADCVKGRCVKNSRAASLLCAAEMFLHDLFEAYIRWIDVFIAASQFVASRLYARGIDAGRVEIIPNAVDPDRWSPAKNAGAGDYVLYAGRLTREKGTETMIRALAERPEIPLKVAGTGMNESRCRMLARELGADNIEFLGFRREEEIRRLMQGCRFVVVPSEWYENAPMSVLEAFACGRPAVGTRMGGIPELVREGETGLLTEAGGEQGLREAVGSLWSDPDLAGRMGENARRLAETDYSSQTHCDRIINVYQKVKRT